MPREVNLSHAKAARLRGSGVEWTVALKKAKVLDTDVTRNSVRKMIRKLMSKAEAKAKAKAEAKREVAAADMQAKRKDLKALKTAHNIALRKARPAASMAAEDAAVAVKAKLTVARGKLRRWGVESGEYMAAWEREDKAKALKREAKRVEETREERRLAVAAKNVKTQRAQAVVLAATKVELDHRTAYQSGGAKEATSRSITVATWSEPQPSATSSPLLQRWGWWTRA